MSEEISFFGWHLKMNRSSVTDGDVGGGGGGSLHLPGTVKENVLESDFDPHCDDTTRRRSLADLRLLEGM